jgi:hypothetical protein
MAELALYSAGLRGNALFDNRFLAHLLLKLKFIEEASFAPASP